VMDRLLRTFLKKAKGDGRLGPSHISLYVSLVVCSAGASSFVIDRVSLMTQARILARQTYTLRLRELADFGYIKYTPSNDPRVGSRVELVSFDKSGR